MLEHEELLAILTYIPDTGEFFWKNGRLAGSNKGHHNPYNFISINKRSYRAHRLAWFYMTGTWPTKGIDHKDGNGYNNRWTNLREATQSQNIANSTRINKSGYKGVYLHVPTGRYNARIRVNYKRISLGYFNTKEDAADAYNRAALKYFGEFAKCSPVQRGSVVD